MVRVPLTCLLALLVAPAGAQDGLNVALDAAPGLRAAADGLRVGPGNLHMNLSVAEPGTALVRARQQWLSTGGDLHAKPVGRGPDIQVRAEHTAPEAAVSRFVDDVVRKPAFVTVELEPPRNLDLKLAFSHAERLARVGVDAINIPDNALARVHMNHVIFAQLLSEIRRISILPFVQVLQDMVADGALELMLALIASNS